MRFLPVVFLAVTFVCPLVAARAAEHPNVLFISIDDLNDWVGCFGGHPQAQTPHIDALAGRGVTFTNAHCQAPICNPSRVSMLIGKLPSTTGMYFLGPPFRSVAPTKDAETLFQTFRKHGYYLSTRGKIFHGKADPVSFDHIEPNSGWRRGPKKVRYTLPAAHPLWDWGQVEVPDRQQRDYLTADWAAKELPELAKKKQPFFLAVGFHLPHVPIYASKKWFDLYPLQSVQLPATQANDRQDLPEIAKTLSLNSTAPRHKWMVDSGEWRHAVQAYLATNSFVDHLVGMVLDGLDDSGQADNTIVVLWSDHGFHLGEKLRWAKRSLWQETTRVPLIISGPQISGDARCSRPVGLIDVYPTLLELCDLPARGGLDGSSLKPLLDDPQAKWDRPAICTFGPGNHSLCGQRYHYIVYADGSEELYDLEMDPHEFDNLLAARQQETAHSDTIAKIVQNFRRWLPPTNAPPVPGSAGSDSPLYGEGGKVSLQEAMRRGQQKLDK